MAFQRNCWNSDSIKIGPSCWSSIGIPPSSGARGKSQSSGNTRFLPYSKRKATRRSAESVAASRSCHTWVRFSLKWVRGDAALTVRRSDFYRRSSAGFDRIAFFIMTRLICTGTLTRSRSLMSPCCKAVKGVSRKHTGNLFFYCLLTEAVWTLSRAGTVRS